MQRNTQALLGLLFVVAVAVALILTRQSRVKARAPIASASASATPLASASVAAPVGSFESQVETALTPEDGTGEAAFDVLPSGGKAPPLPESAPQSVTFGVVQFGYDGAQFASKGSRTKEQAKQKALGVMELAKTDFEAAVQKGDRGSRSNVGRMYRGILEPAVEYLLFTLPKATVYAEPIDTPRGYWIVRRID